MMLARRLLLGYGGPDPYWDNVDLLLNPDGDVGSTSMVDLAGNYTLSANGTAPVISEALGPKTIFFSNGAIIANSVLSYLHDGATLWTIDYEIYRSSDAPYQCFFVNTSNDTVTVYKYIQGYIFGGTNDLASTSIGKTPSAPYFSVASGNNSVPISAWTKVRVTFDGTYLRQYVNGVLNGECPKPSGLEVGTDAKSVNFRIGRFTSGAYPFGGHLKGFRITRGVARPGSENFVTPFPTE